MSDKTTESIHLKMVNLGLERSQRTPYRLCIGRRGFNLQLYSPQVPLGMASSRTRRRNSDC